MKTLKGKMPEIDWRTFTTFEVARQTTAGGDPPTPPVVRDKIIAKDTVARVVGTW